MKKISLKMIFVQPDISDDEYRNFMNNKNLRKTKIKTSDGEILEAGLYNSYRRPKYSDIIFLYSYGNSGWMGWTLHSSTVKMLSKFGSVFLYDYRGYGKSTGSVQSSHEEGAFEDIRTAWRYLTNIKNINPNNIILFGNSLGTSITAHFLHELAIYKKTLPRAMILQNPFHNIQDISKELNPLIGNFVVSTLNTDKFMKKIDENLNDFDIIILHSKEDELIGHHHGHKLSKIPKNNRCRLVSINGYHNDCKYTKMSDSIIRKIVHNKILHDE